MIALNFPSIDRQSQDLQYRVALFLEQRHVTFGSRLKIKAERGVVTLAGQVPTFHQRQLIHSFARRVAGVVQVVDQLEVAPPATSKPRASRGTVLV